MESPHRESINFQRISRAISLITRDFKSQPSLDEIAAQLGLSPFHFQRLFVEWAGISPKKFLQYLSISYAKSLLREKQLNLFDTAFETGLSGTGRLHDLFVKIEGMTPAEYQHGGANLTINYSYLPSLFGNLLVASTARGLCYMAFEEDENLALQKLYRHFPGARLQSGTDEFQRIALTFFKKNDPEYEPLKLHIKGTPFQLKVWESLLKIPEGRVCTYQDIAQEVAGSGAARAVGTAIGKNPVALLIPCHRVIKSSGEFGGYMWGMERKAALIGWEAAKINHPEK